MGTQDGLDWVSEIFGLEPRWTREPDIAKIELIARRHFKLRSSAACTVKFYTQGVSNKIYKVETEDGISLMRVAMPVDAINKTNNEVATIDFIRQNTDLLVPQFFASNASSNNELGFEWILMEMVPGSTLRSIWRESPLLVKRALVREMAKYQAQLFRHQFPAIGNIRVFPSPEAVLKGGRAPQGFPKSPFTDSEAWLRARLELALADQKRILKTSGDQNTIKDAGFSIKVIERLLGLLPSIFPPFSRESAQFVLFHHDLSCQNMLVDDNKNFLGVLDWGFISALPLWKACQLPYFLRGEGGHLYEHPFRDDYSQEGHEDGFANHSGSHLTYWEHLEKHELTKLRCTFLKEMKRLEPAWIREFEESAVKAEFELAVQVCDDRRQFNRRQLNRVKLWLDRRDAGEKNGHQ
ncbi:hypothetical protein LOCC1_G002696 [Lachnellula occidentalis]|uniref:Aminoglycoside phosphotransferase domain-containing protein n=1 Tax=Lachnellula occidentalis TaxID=215460 RepID=A0A8H8UG28_9HELO|nr:hypothetical protein LOCC1_G002696 [Lachnellula occidentalis]